MIDLDVEGLVGVWEDGTRLFYAHLHIGHSVHVEEELCHLDPYVCLQLSLFTIPNSIFGAHLYAEGVVSAPGTT